MSWKPLKRTVPSVSKVKLPGKPPLPEPADAMSPRNEGYFSEPLEHMGGCRDVSYTMSEFLSSLPVASQDVEENYLDSQVFNFGGDADLENSSFGDLAISEASSWDSSVASFMSWNDEIEAESTEQTRRFLEEVDSFLYEDGPASIEDQEIVDECLTMKKFFPFLRLLGKPFKSTQELPTEISVVKEQAEDTTEEIIMSHGCVDDNDNLSPERRKGGDKSFDESHDPQRASNHNLLDKVKKAALEQLSCYVLSEVMKSVPQTTVSSSQFGEELSQSTSVSSFFDSSSSSSVSDLSENLSGVLTISRKSIHRSPRKSSSKTTENYCHTRVVKLPVQPKRFLCSSHSARKPNHEPNLSFSVLGVPKPLYCEPLNSNVRRVDSRGFHSAADRRKSGFWERRFSCVSTDNESILKPLEERGGSAWGPSTRFVNAQQMSVTSAPRLQRHLTLPPINNADTSNRVGKVSPRNSPEAETRHLSFKKKGILSPLPQANNIPEGGVSQLQLAKQLLEKMPDKPSWSPANRINFTNTRDPNRWRRSKVRNMENI